MADIQNLNHAGPSNILQVIPEIIDVDALPDTIATTAPHQPRPSHRSSSHARHRASSSRHSEVIYVPDSDEDVGAPRPFSGASRHRLISPPAPYVRRSVPPVPAMPRRFGSHRQRSHSGQPPPIIPNAVPFAFEAEINLQPQTPTLPTLPSRGAPRSQHQPVMGLGGALIALNRREEEQRLNAQQAAGQRRIRNPFSAIADTFMHYFASRPETPPGHVAFMDAGDLMAEAWANDPWDGEWLPEEHRQADLLGPPKRVTKPAWLPSYTHPGNPDPGFTFSFDVEPKDTKPASPAVIVIDLEEDQTASSSASSTTAVEPSPVLVCARCLDPLVIAGQDGSEISDIEAKKIRVWALRCGHMLDGKCINEIMRPEPIVEEKPAKEDEDGTAEIEMDSVGAGQGSRSKGKGKVKVAAVAVDPRSKGKGVEQEFSRSDMEVEDVVTMDNSIRSRLRSRGIRSMASLANTDVSMASVSSAGESMRPIRPLPQRRGAGRAAQTSSASVAKPKSKGKARKPIVEVRHEWFCPVAGCCMEHGSVRMRGEEDWKMDETLGAIGLFV